MYCAAANYFIVFIIPGPCIVVRGKRKVASENVVSSSATRSEVNRGTSTTTGSITNSTDKLANA